MNMIFKALETQPQTLKMLDLDSPAIKLICEVLRNHTAAWPQEAGEEFEALFLTQSAGHGVQALLYYQLKSRSEWLTWPARLRESL
ncbi:MAG: hypothetical protein V2J55_14350, partial [Candidatus Competibacteraceae bacterium]|nr:hypothetical protein [Candidatus Competibacteraceae bacterium]